MSVTAGITTTVDTRALDETIARLEAVDTLIAEYVDRVETEAKRLVPVVTGALRDSIVTHLDGLVGEITAGEGLPDPRAVIVEYGSAKAPSHPYLRPALMRYEADFLAAVADLFL